MSLFAPAPAPLTATVLLAKGRVWSHAARRTPLRLRCTSGLLWLTADTESRDVLLHPGETWVSTNRCRVVVQALEPSRMAALVGEPVHDQLPLPPAAPGLAR